MPTPDASQFTEIKRYQSNINTSLAVNPLKFRVPSFYGGYRPNYSIGFLPPNALLSNKLLPPPPPPPPLPPNINFNYELYVVSQLSSPSPGTPDIADNTTWGTRDDTNLTALLTTGNDYLNQGVIVPSKTDSRFDYNVLHMSGIFTPIIDGVYLFQIVHNNGLQFKINEEYLLNTPGFSETGDQTTNGIYLDAGRSYPIEALWVHGTGQLGLEITLLNIAGTGYDDIRTYFDNCISKT